MKLPKSLYIGYRLLGESRLITKRDSDPEALQYFQTVLNKAQPVSSEELLLHRFVRAMYNENKNKFLSFIRNTYFECLVLWTDHITIVNFTGLRGVIYIEWNNTNKSYAVSKFRTRGKEVETKTLVRHGNKYTPLDSKDTDGETPVSDGEDTKETNEPATTETTEPATTETTEPATTETTEPATTETTEPATTETTEPATTETTEPATTETTEPATTTARPPTVQKKKSIRRLNKNESWANVVDSD
jgi:cytoskeletal protein RodZ